MRNESNLQLLTSFTRSASPTQLAAGNSTVPTLAALQTLRSRKFCSADLEQNDNIDLVKRSLASNDFIRNVTSPIFTATLCKESQIRILKKWSDETPFRRAYLDATGNILRKISDQHNVLHHFLLIQVYVANDKVSTPFNLAELITTTQKAPVITEFLRTFLQFTDEKTKRNTLWFHEIVTDKSFANIGAILRAFNDMTLSNYLETCWKILAQEDIFSLKKLVVVRLCSSHTTKTIMDDIRKYFKDKNVAFTMCSMIGTMFNIKGFKDLLQYVEQILFTLMSPLRGENMMKVKMDCLEILEKVGERGTENEEFHEDWDKDVIETDHQSCEFNDGPIYSNSKFYKHFVGVIAEFDFDIEGSENPFYSPNFAQLFLKHHLSYLPLWSNIMTCLRDDKQPRANNGLIENFNGLKKRKIREAAQEIGSFGRIKVGRYVEFESKQVDILVKKIENNIASRSTPRTTKKRLIEENLTEENIMHSQEQYNKRMPRTTKRFSTFFTKSVSKKVKPADDIIFDDSDDDSS